MYVESPTEETDIFVNMECDHSYIGGSGGDAHHGPKAAWLFMSAAKGAAEILGSQGVPAVGAS